MAPDAPSPIRPLEVEYLQGIHVVDSVLWFDAPRPSDLCFISHAHFDQPVAHRKILSTEATAALLRPHLAKGKILVTPYRRRLSLGDLDLWLHPSGHMLGAAQILVQRGATRIVYTGDFTLEPPRTAEPALVLDADVLVMETTYGLPHQVFPPRAEVEEALLDWTRRTLAAGGQPVFLTPPLGKAQELARLLADNGLKVRAHKTAFEHGRIYRKAGVRLPFVRLFRKTLADGEVLLFPPHLSDTETLKKLPGLRTAVATGAAIEPNARARWNVDAAFPLSGHADHRGLLRYVRESGARRIFLVGRAAPAFAEELRALGFDAWPLRPPEQLGFFERES